MQTDMSYEEAMKQLEEIIEGFENQETLELTLKKYKKGIELYNYCSNLLKKAEGEIKIIQKDRKNLEDYDYIREDEDDYY